MNDDVLQSIKARQRPSPARARSTPASPPRRKRRSPLGAMLLLGLGCAVAVLAAGSVAAAPMLALIVGTDAPAPAHPGSFAQAWIAKPTYTPTVLEPVPTVTPAPSAAPDVAMAAPVVVQPVVESPVEVAQPAGEFGELFAEIVADTPTVEYVVSQAGEAASQEQAPAPSYGGSKYILVDISEQHMYVYENNALVFSFVSSTGMNNATAAGHFSVLDKIPSAYGATWDIWMPNWLGIYWAGGLENGIHALPILPNGLTLWSGFLGRPISYGCVVLGSYEAQLLYDWAEVGTPVEIQW